MKRRPTSNKAQESRPVETVIEDGTSERLLSGGQGTPDRALKIQFGELQGDVDHFGADSPASFNETNSSGDVATSPLPSSMCALRQLWTLNAQNALPDASNNDTLTQATSSRPSSAPPTLKFPSDDLAHDPRQPLQTSVVELPAEASISRSSSLKISFLYQEDLDSASQASTPYSGSPTLSVLPAMSHLPPTMHGLPNVPPYQPSAGGNAGGSGPGFLDSVSNYHPRVRPFLPRTQMVPAAMVSLSVHLLCLFDLKIRCDQEIMVHVPGTSAYHCYFDAHKIIMFRSPMLALSMHDNTASGNENGSVNVFWPTAYFNQIAFAMCLRYLYSDTVLSIDDIEAFTDRGASQHIAQWRGCQLMFTIAYWLGGLILRADAVATQAESIVHGLINFDIIGIALDVATDLCDHELSGGERNPNDTPLTHRYRNFESYPAAFPPDDVSVLADPFPLDHRRKMFEIAGKLGARLNEMIFSSIAANITFKDFQLDTTLEQTLVKHLLPITRELADHYRPLAPVQTLQFGQFPPQQAANPTRNLSMKNRHTSYIMLNLPFGNLKQAVAILRKAAKASKVEDIWVKDFVKKVIAEREARRHIVIRSVSVSDEEQQANMAVWRVVGYEESVVEDEATGEWDLQAECSDSWARYV